MADASLKQHQLWYLKQAEAQNDQNRIRLEVDKSVLELESRVANLRHIEADLESIRQAHYSDWG